MKVNDTDKKRAENLAKMLRRGKWELEGEEILAFAQTYNWLGTMLIRMDEDLARNIKKNVENVVRKDVAQIQVQGPEELAAMKALVNKKKLKQRKRRVRQKVEEGK